MQALLLRFAETGEMQPIGADALAERADVRLITATNRDLRAQIAAEAFREDLYYRLNVIQIQVPPLRERGEDILLLLEYYLERAAAAHGLRPPALTPEAAQLLLAYAWPGNVRELRNVTERLVVQDRSRPVRPDDLPLEIRGAHPAPIPVVVPAPGDAAGPRGTPADSATAERVQRLWDRIQAGDDFWTVVHQAFKAREVTRAELIALIDRGLRETQGSYRTLLTVFHLAPTEYKRFHGFLHQQRCNLPVAPYRGLRPGSSPVPQPGSSATRPKAS
jgi:DNA-binding NtrC family response regulator